MTGCRTTRNWTPITAIPILTSMTLASVTLACVTLASVTLWGSCGVDRLTTEAIARGDLLPLSVGNRWTYERVNQEAGGGERVIEPSLAAMEVWSVNDVVGVAAGRSSTEGRAFVLAGPGGTTELLSVGDGSVWSWGAADAPGLTPARRWPARYEEAPAGTTDLLVSASWRRTELFEVAKVPAVEVWGSSTAAPPKTNYERCVRLNGGTAGVRIVETLMCEGVGIVELRELDPARGNGREWRLVWFELRE